VDFRLTEDQEALRSGIRDFCDGRVGVDQLRELEGEACVDAGLWSELAEMGVFSLRQPESSGGVGLGMANGWMHVKLALVLLVLGYHHACRRLLNRFEQSANQRSERWFRVFNECSVLLFAAIVVLVVVKPF